MFLHNKYTRWYFSIVDRSKVRILDGYCEKHHIIPKSMGGEDSDTNIARLTAREHFICHLLLTKMVIGVAKYKMVRAANALAHYRSNREAIKVNSRIYQSLKEQYAASMRGPRSEETRRKMSEAAKKRVRSPLSEKHKQAIARGRTGKKHDKATRKKISEAAIEKFKSDEARQKLSESVKKRMADEDVRRHLLDGVKLRDERRVKPYASVLLANNQSSNA